MKKTNGGFTVIEMVVTMTFGLILLDIALGASGETLDRVAVSSARTTFAALHSRARVRAVERGRNVRLIVDPATDSAWVADGEEIVEGIAFRTASGVDLTATSAIELCLSPRGSADRDCNSFTSTVEVGFSRGGASASLGIQPLGQLVMRD